MIPAPFVMRRGSGVPVLFVHGNGVDHRALLPLDDVFSEEWERISFDLPGFGGTPALGAPGGLPQLADWVDAAVGELVGTTPFALVGSSLGGLLAREVAARRPAQCLGMALLAPVVDSVHEHRTLPATVVLHEDPALLAELPPEDAAPYAQLAVVQSRENWERFRDSILPGLHAADARAMARLSMDYALRELPDERLASFDRPVLIVAGRQDWVVGFEDQWALAQRLPHATYAMLDRAGHNIEADQPEAVRDLLVHWAAQLVA